MSSAHFLLAFFGLLSGQEASASEPGALVLQPERTVRFETEEGTYMNLDVSPDGSTIVFDLLGDLYTLPVTGGDATRITSGMAYDVQPVFSPDGSEIAFISDASGSDNIWVVAPDGSDPRRVTNEEEEPVAAPEFSPDGDYLVARRGRKLWLYHRHGGSGMELTSENEARDAMGALFSPDGRFVYFTSRVSPGGTGRAPTDEMERIIAWQVKRLDRENGDIATITASPNGAFRPAVSSDGRFMVYGLRVDAKTGLRLRDLQTKEERWLAYDIDRDNAERPGMLDLMPRAAFTPDGRAIILATGGTFQRLALPEGGMTPVPFRADVEQSLAHFVFNEYRHTDEPVDVKNLRSISRSPDGSKLVFSALSQIWIQDLSRPGEAPRALLEQPFGQFHPVFSPSGEAVVYVSWDDVEGGHLWLMKLDESAPRRLTEHPGFYLRPSFSPDGRRIAYLEEDAAAFRNVWTRNTGQLMWVSASGEGGESVISAPTDNQPTFDASGGRVYYLSEIEPANPREDKKARSVLVSVNLDGADKKIVAEIEAETYEAVPSPDARWLAFSVREDIFLAALPRTSEVAKITETRGPGPVARITREGGIDLRWEDGGDTLAWSFGDKLYRMRLDDAVAVFEDPERVPAIETTDINLRVPRHRPRGTVALVGGNVITMSGEGVVIENATVIVTDNRIVAVGPSSSVEIPAGTREVDVAGKTLMPGLVDIHAHLRPPREVFVESSWSYFANLAYGVTTTRDVSSSNDSFAYGELVEAGRSLGPRIYSTGRAMTTGNAKIESLDDARAMVRHYKKLGTSVIKQYMQPHRRQRQWVVQAAREESMNVTNEGGGDFRLDMTMVLDGYTGFEHSLPLANIYSDVTRLIAESRTWYTPTLVVSYGGPTAEWYFYQSTNVHDDEKLNRFTPHEILDRRTRRGRLYAEDEFHFDEVARIAADVLRRGGNVALGAHGEEQGICAHWELWALQMGGLSSYDALRTATTIAADGLGMAKDLGRIESGMLADILVLDESPLEDIRNSNTVRYVMKNGELFEADTLEMLWPERKALPSFLYRDQGPPPTTPEEHR